MNSDDLLKSVFDRLQFCMACSDIDVELQKMVSMELTMNPQAKELEYFDVLHVVILRLVNFYGDEQLKQLWLSYLQSLREEEEAA